MWIATRELSEVQKSDTLSRMQRRMNQKPRRKTQLRLDKERPQGEQEEDFQSAASWPQQTKGAFPPSSLALSGQEVSLEEFIIFSSFLQTLLQEKEDMFNQRYKLERAAGS